MLVVGVRKKKDTYLSYSCGRKKGAHFANSITEDDSLNILMEEICFTMAGSRHRRFQQDGYGYILYRKHGFQ